MPYLAVAKSVSKRLGGVVPPLEMLNLYAEATDTNASSGYDLLTRPCLADRLTISTPGVTGLFYQPSSVALGTLSGLYASVGPGLYKVGTSSASVLGSISGPLPPQMAFGSTEEEGALIASGGTLQRTFGGTLTNVDFPDNQTVISTAYMNGYFLAAAFGTQSIYYTDPVTGEFDGARRVLAVLSSDQVLRIERWRSEILAFGERTIEVFAPTEQDTSETPPFLRVSTRAYERGCEQPATVVQMAGTVVFVADDATVCLLTDQAVPISTPWVQERIAAASRASTFMTAWELSWPGHDFYVLTLGSLTTLAFDFATKLWHEWTDADLTAWRATHGVEIAPGVTVVGDRTAGKLYTVTDALSLDAGATAMMQRFTAVGPLEDRQILRSLSVDTSAGHAAAAVPMKLETSTDQGATWDDHGDESLGAAGAYLERVRWTRLGQFEPPMLMTRHTVTGAFRGRFSNVRVADNF